MFRDIYKTGRLLGVFMLGCALFSYPILSLFNLKILILGIPLLYLFIFAGWLGLILLVFWGTKMLDKPRVPKSSDALLTDDLFDSG